MQLLETVVKGLVEFRTTLVAPLFSTSFAEPAATILEKEMFNLGHEGIFDLAYVLKLHRGGIVYRHWPGSWALNEHRRRDVQQPGHGARYAAAWRNDILRDFPHFMLIKVNWESSGYVPFYIYILTTKALWKIKFNSSQLRQLDFFNFHALSIDLNFISYELILQ